MNTLEYASIFQEELDNKMTVGLTSGWMGENAGQVIYNGGSEVKMPIIDMDGLADYDRNDGYTKGSVRSQYKTYTLTQDRGRSFQLDVNDIDETNFAVAVGRVMGVFQSEKVVPEVDAYVYSKLASLAIENNRFSDGYTPHADTIFDMLLNDIAAVQDEVGEGVPLVITMSGLVSRILSSSQELRKNIDVTDFTKGEITTKMRSINEIPIITAPSARMKSEYLFKTGGEGQEEGGFAPTANAKNINWTITSRTSPILVTKTDKIRIFSPDVNQKAHAWGIDYRKYYDLWYPFNKLNTLHVSFKESIQ